MIYLDTFLELSEPLKIYPNISKFIQDIQRYTKIYKIPSGASGPGRAGRPRRRLVFVYLNISSYVLDIFGYIFGICFWYIFDIFSRDAMDPHKARVFLLMVPHGMYRVRIRSLSITSLHMHLPTIRGQEVRPRPK